ncbi:MAG: YebC/PmpR family DNA-binding transcriptional regulator [Pseudomonadota bacterium]|nr:YebC/PmpR family DNA-binding transcriptional regulator [Pseudomonadota bacterium]
MAGHSKWSNIKHRKAAQDAKRGKVFTKLIREITVAARLGGGVPEDNPRLRAAIDKALGANMPRDTIDRAIARGSGSGDEDNVEELVYEGYAPGGVAVYVEVMTDNRNRTVAEVRHAFNKHGGNLGTDGSVAYLFTKQGVLSFAPGADEEALLEAGLEAGAQDVVTQDDGSVEVLADPADYLAVKEAMVAAGHLPDNAELAMLPATYVELEGEQAQQVLELLNRLEDLDDVQNVYSNADFPDALLGGD